MEWEQMKSHVRTHVSYPATKEDLVRACNQMSDVPAEDRQWFQNNLPDGTYNSADEVIAKLGL